MKCDVCKDQGIVVVGKNAFRTTQPCKACGADHGYFQQIRNLYSTNLPSGIKLISPVKDNLYELNLQKRQKHMYEEAAQNNGFLPIKSDGNNLYDLNEHRMRKNDETKEET